MKRTDDLLTADELYELFGTEPGNREPLADVIPTCSGEWRREGGMWRGYDAAEDE